MQKGIIMDNVEVELVDAMFKLVFEKEEYLASLISSFVEQFGIVVKQVQKNEYRISRLQ
jgi:hypothetical protein